jgi:hypothetical protein
MESGIGNRESGIGNRESGIGKGYNVVIPAQAGFSTAELVIHFDF